jgi:hypothetical protein
MEMSSSVAGTKVSLLGGHTTGDFGDAKALRKFGDVPDDLSRCDRI